MGAFGGLVLTNKGRILQAKTQAGATLTYTRIAIGEGQLGTTPIADLSALKSEKMSLPILKLKVQSDSRVVIGTVLDNNSLINGFTFREIGVFAQDPDVGEVLYCYGNAGALGEYIPAGGGADIVEKAIDVQVLTGNAASVTAVIDESLVFATLESVQEQVDLHANDGSKHITSDERTKLAGVEAEANKYIHPATHSPTIISQDENNRFVTDAEKTNWNTITTHTADYLKHTGYSVATGSANAYIATLNPALSAYAEGVSLRLKINVTNTGPSTIAINGLAAKTIKKANGSDVAAGNLKAGSIYTLVYNDVNFILQGEGGGEGTALAADVLASKTFTNDTGEVVTGTMPNNGGAATITPGTANVVKPAGYYSGAQTIAGDADLVAANIKAGINIFGVAGKASVVDTFDATALAAEILVGDTAYVNGVKVTGTMPNNGGAATITPGTANIVKPAGYYSGAQTIEGDPDLIPANILSGKNIFNVAGALVLGKKFATGTAVNGTSIVNFGDTQTGTLGAYPLIVSGLDFIPSIVIAMMVDTNSSNDSRQVVAHATPITYPNGRSTQVIGTQFHTMTSSSHTDSLFKFGTSGYMNQGGFCIPVVTNTAKTWQYWAFE
ncbi:MAG: phage tail protein [Paenisporosarcina sp.]